MAGGSLFLVLLLFTSMLTSSPASASAVHHLPSNAKTLDLNLNLNWGSGDEFGMSYEEHTRRVLAGNSRYISYEALRRDSVPCGRRGASYYNCRPGAHANPYSRGCSTITRCRR